MKPMIEHWVGRGLGIGLAAATLGVACGPAQAASFEPGRWLTASLARLEALRGGFEPAPGLKVSFGMVRTVDINGEVVSRTSFQLPDMSRISEAQARMVNLAMRDAGLVQNGPGNYLQRDSATAGSSQASAGAGVPAPLAGAMPGLGAATIIQNTLDNQVIRQITEISTGVNTLGVLKVANAQAALRDALLGGLGAR